MEKQKNITRKNGWHLRVPVLPEEERAIKEQAKTAGLSIAAYLRNVALGYEIRSFLDLDSVLQLAKINADQGRLGGLLKMWLTNHEKLRGYDSEQLKLTILGVLERIAENQNAMLSVVTKI